jgi:hypothetical protein
VGLALQFSSNPMVPQKIALLIEVAFAFLGLGAGMFLLNQAGSRRNLGIAFLAICVLAVLGGIVAAPPEAAAKGPAAGANSKSAPAEAAAVAADPVAPAAAAPVVAPVTAVAGSPAVTAPPVAKTPSGGAPLSGPRKPKVGLGSGQ